MAPELEQLDETRRISGAKLLKLTDEVGFNAVMAAWMRNLETDRWEYLLVTPMIDTRGPSWVYQRLLIAFQKLHLPEGITPLDIHVASPNEARFRDFPFVVEGEPEGNRVFTELTIGVWPIRHVVLYRSLPKQNQAADPSWRFDACVSSLMVA